MVRTFELFFCTKCGVALNLEEMSKVQPCPVCKSEISYNNARAVTLLRDD